MFEIGYFAGSNEMVPTGWNVVDEDKTYPAISTRNPQVQQPIDDDSGTGFEDGRAGSESSDESLVPNGNRNVPASDLTRMADEDESDEDEDLQPLTLPRVSCHFYTSKQRLFTHAPFNIPFL